MTKALYVPDHVAETAKATSKASVAYINKNEKVLDPSLIDKDLKERLPQPTGWRLLAYKDAAKFGDALDTSWCAEGDWVCIGRYAGARFKIEGGEVRIINDDEVIATILEPDDIKHI